MTNQTKPELTERQRDLQRFVAQKGAGTLMTTPEGRELLLEINPSAIIAKATNPNADTQQAYPKGRWS